MDYTPINRIDYTKTTGGEFYLNIHFLKFFEEISEINPNFENKVLNLYRNLHYIEYKKVLDKIAKNRKRGNKYHLNNFSYFYRSIFVEYIKKYKLNSDKNITIIVLNKELKKLIVNCNICSSLCKLFFNINKFYWNDFDRMAKLFFISNDDYHIYNHYISILLILIKKNICKYIVLNYILPYLLEI